MKKYHYYPNKNPDTGATPATFGDDTTACGRDGLKVGGFISIWFRQTKQNERCKTCDKQFKKEELERR